MAVQPLLHPRFRALDANGDPLSGGLLYSYSAGTTTPLATYTTRAGTVANANPVVLDANGEADVWVTGGVLYKFVLKNSAGVTQWTADNVPSAGADVAVADGTVSAPGLAFTNDVNTGIYRPTTDQLAIATGGVRAALFTASSMSVPGTFAAAGGIAGALDLNANKIIDLATPTDATDAVTKAYVDAATGSGAAIPRAWARIQTNGAGAVSIVDGHNVASVATSATDRIELTLTAPGVAVMGNSGAVITEIGGPPTTAVCIYTSLMTSTTVLRIGALQITTTAAVTVVDFQASTRNLLVVVFGDAA